MSRQFNEQPIGDREPLISFSLLGDIYPDKFHAMTSGMSREELDSLNSSPLETLQRFGFTLQEIEDAQPY